MKKLLPLAVAVTGAVFVLAACGSDGGSDDPDDIKGADSPTSSPSSSGPSGTGRPDADRPGHPKVLLPSGLSVTFEGFVTGDKARDAVLADSAARVRAMTAAKAEGTAESDAVTFYTHPMAEAGARKALKYYADKGYSLTGEFRYFAPQVTLSGESAELTYCGDESKGFGKVRKSGKILKTPVSDDSYVGYTARLRKNADGVWQTADISTDRGAAQCRP
ncbi:hypothetical protein [Streptomyces sp. NPDC018031]|uniref:hypothetical protein n=1 Tax=Streptomyces sp. NPDC018031 TaxID=3365033 RepID=UPI00378B2F4A